jgi:hypothetical protein
VVLFLFGGKVNPTRNRSSIIYLLLFVAIISMVVYNFTQGSMFSKR